MKRLLISFLIVMFFFNGLRAQWGRGLYDSRSETHNYLTTSFGPAFCFSDAQGSWMNQINLNNYNVSFGYRRLYASNFGFKATFDYSAFTGNDKGSKYVRRYSYSSNVMQAAIQAEYTLRIGDRSYYNSVTNAIYGFVGAGVLRSDATLKGVDTPNYIVIAHYVYNTVNYAPVIPYGLGYQYYISRNFFIGFEAFGRYPLSDLIDGFKPPQSISKNNDVMGGVSLTLSFLLGSEYLKRN
jgi:hypothetical protein